MIYRQLNVVLSLKNRNSNKANNSDKLQKDKINSTKEIYTTSSFIHLHRQIFLKN